MTVFAFIPARAGSQRVPRKNLAEVGGSSLVHRACRAAYDALTDTVSLSPPIVVSTDDDEIANAARADWGATVHQRPEHLATATAQIEDAIAHWLARSSLKDDDVIALLQPTSPFRRSETIRSCVHLVTEYGLDSAIAVKRDFARATLNGRVRGLWSESEQRDVGLKVIWNHQPDFRPRSQDTRNVGVDCGLCYTFTAGHFRRTRSRMAQITGAVPVSAIEAFDIDTPADLEHARILAPHAERLIAMEEM